MNRDEMTLKIKECLSDLNIQTGDYIVIFESAFVLRGITESCDSIDITIRHDVFDSMVESLGIIPEKYDTVPNKYKGKQSRRLFKYKKDITIHRRINCIWIDPKGIEVDNGIVTHIFSDWVDKKYKKERSAEDIEIINSTIERFNKSRMEYNG